MPQDLPELPLPDGADARPAHSRLASKLSDLLVPGFAVDMDPDEAECLGAFAEDAISEPDAQDSTADLPWAIGSTDQGGRS